MRLDTFEHTGRALRGVSALRIDGDEVGLQLVALGVDLIEPAVQFEQRGGANFRQWVKPKKSAVGLPVNAFSVMGSPFWATR